MGPLPCADACCAQVRNAMTAPDGQNPRGDKLSQHTAVPRHGAGSPCHLAPLPPPAAHPLGAQILEIAIPSPTEKTKNRRRKARQTGHTQTGHCMPPKRRREDAAEGQGRKTRSRAGTGRRESDSGGAKAPGLRRPKARIRGVPLPTSIHDAGTGSGDYHTGRHSSLQRHYCRMAEAVRGA